MKRLITLIAMLALLVGVLPAYAAGAMNASEEVWYVAPRAGEHRIYYYATVENTGDEAATINDLLFEADDAAGADLASTSRYALYPSVLQSGETGYLAITLDVKDLQDEGDVDHCTLTFTSKKQDDKAARRLDAAAEYLSEDEEGTKDVLRTAVTNTGTDDAFDINSAVAARDAQGRLLFVAGATARDIGLVPGAQLLMRTSVPEGVADALEEEQTRIDSLDAIAWVLEDVED